MADLDLTFTTDTVGLEFTLSDDLDLGFTGLTVVGDVGSQFPEAVVRTDYSVKTDESLEGARALSPVEDLDAWESAGGPADWGLPSDRTSVVTHVDVQSVSRMGVYVYDPTSSPSTFTRHADYSTVESLDGKALLSRLSRKHLDDSVPATNLANLVLIWTTDSYTSSTVADSVDWSYGVFADLSTVQDYVSYLEGVIANTPSGPDDSSAWTQSVVTTSFLGFNKNFIGGSPDTISLGTGGQAILFHYRVGRLIFCKLTAIVGADHEPDLWILPFSALPATPAAALITDTSSFGYVSYGETSPGAADGGLIPVGPSIVPGFSGVAFVLGVSANHNGALSNLWATDGGNESTTDDLTGKSFNILASFWYEPAAAAP